MKTIYEHIEHVKGRPHHIRKRVAFTTALCGALLVGVLWFGVSLASGGYALHGSNFAEATGAESSMGGSPVTSTSQLAGAAAALNQDSASQPAHIEIVDATSTTTPSAPEQTVIPF